MHSIFFSAGISTARCNVIRPSWQVTVAVSVINHVVSHYTLYCGRAAYLYTVGRMAGLRVLGLYVTTHTDHLLFDKSSVKEQDVSPEAGLCGIYATQTDWYDTSDCSSMEELLFLAVDTYYLKKL